MKILVNGDSCTDVFVYGQIDRLCPEAPVPIFQSVSQKENGGMARNVKKKKSWDREQARILSRNK